MLLLLSTYSIRKIFYDYGQCKIDLNVQQLGTKNPNISIVIKSI